jgi:hypothetical protein
MPFVATRNHTFQSPIIGNTTTAEKQTCEVGSTLVPFMIGPNNDV